MYGHHIVGVFESRAAAQQARARLTSAGVSEDNIYLSGEEASLREERREGQTGGFFDWLIGGNSLGRDRDWYQGNVTGGRTAVSVLADEGHDESWLADQLAQAGAVELEDDETAAAGVQGKDRAAQFSAEGAVSGAESAQSGGTTEEVIPVAKEELEVGKRTTETRHRVRTRVVERPVEADVRLKDERVVVERRPASGARSESGLQDRDVEVIERHEEPVVSKRAGAQEEVVIRKEGGERTEKVRDTLRETKVDVEGESDTGRDHQKPVA
jgi:stress response protein YsnF